MKYFYLSFICVIFVVCCSSSSNNNKGNDELILLRDSVSKLVQNGEMRGDTNLIRQALVLSDSLLKIDTLKIARIHYYINRSGAYYLLGDSINAIVEAEKAYLLYDKDNIMRMSYFAVKYHKLGMRDSAKYYFDKTIAKYDRLLMTNKDKYLDNVMRKAMLLDVIKGRKETLLFLDVEKKKYPKMKELEYYIKGVREKGILDRIDHSEDY